MIYKTEILKVSYEKMGQKSPEQLPKLYSYIVENTPEIDINRKRPAIVICPGGGYCFTSDREAEPVALKFIAGGYHAFVLRYSVAPMRYPASLVELSAAVAHIRANADEYNVDKDKIIVCGFSAGGHLVSSLGVYWNKDEIKELSGALNGENKPNGLILCYPVITSDKEVAHLGSVENLMGENYTDEQANIFASERHVSLDTPETFIWHTAEDTCVPVQNSLMFATSLSNLGIPFEMHIYKKGSHGLALANQITANNDSNISDDCVEWIDKAINWVGNL